MHEIKKKEMNKSKALVAMVCKMKQKKLYFTIRVLYFKCSLEEHFAKAWLNCKKKRATVFRVRKKGRVTLLKKKDMFTFNFGYQEFILFYLVFFCQWCQVMWMLILLKKIKLLLLNR